MTIVSIGVFIAAGLAAALFGWASTLPLFALLLLLVVLGKRRRVRRRRSPRSTQSNPETSFDLLFALAAKLAKADGRVHEREIQLLERFMLQELRLGLRQRRRAIEIFREAKSTPHSFEYLARRFRATMRNDSLALLSVLELLVRMAAADGAIMPAESKLLARATQIFGLPPESLYTIQAFVLGAGAGPHTQKNGRAQHSRRREQPGEAQRQPAGDPLEEAYRTLHCRPAASDSELRAAYRRLVKSHHPDMARAGSAAKHADSRSVERFHEIQSAYELVRKARGGA